MQYQLEQQVIAAIKAWSAAHKQATPMVGQQITTYAQNQQFVRAAFRLDVAEQELHELAARLDALP